MSEHIVRRYAIGPELPEPEDEHQIVAMPDESVQVDKPPVVISHLFKFPIRHNDFNLLELVRYCKSLCDLSEYRQLRVHRNLVDNSITLEFIIPN